MTYYIVKKAPKVPREKIAVDWSIYQSMNFYEGEKVIVVSGSRGKCRFGEVGVVVGKQTLSGLVPVRFENRKTPVAVAYDCLKKL